MFSHFQRGITFIGAEKQAVAEAGEHGVSQTEGEHERILSGCAAAALADFGEANRIG